MLGLFSLCGQKLRLSSLLKGHYANPPTCQDPVQKEFIKTALLLMQQLGEYDKDFCVELMVQFLEADREVRYV